MAGEDYNVLLSQYALSAEVGRSIAVCNATVEVNGRHFDPMQVGVPRAFFVTDTKAEQEAPLERRLQNRGRQLHLATRPDDLVYEGPGRAAGDPGVVNAISAMYGSPDEIAQRLEALRDAGAGRS